MVLVENSTVRAGYCVCTVDNVIVLVWKAPPILEGVERCEAASQALRKSHPRSKFGFMTYVEPAAQQGAPPAPVRDGLTRFLRENEQKVKASVIIYEGTGFKATIVRSVVTAINLASSLKFPSSVASSRGGGIAWLLGNMQGETVATPEELLAATMDNPRKPEAGRLYV